MALHALCPLFWGCYRRKKEVNIRKRLTTVFVVALLCWSSGVATQDSEQKSEQSKGCGSMKIKLTSIFVDDQEKAIKFYTEVLGFAKKADFPVGEFRWLTVVSALEPEGTELLLEPNVNPSAKTYQKAIFEQGIPATTFFVDDIEKEFNRLKKLGVKFNMEPTKLESATIAIFDDTCGNLIQIAQE